MFTSNRCRGAARLRRIGIARTVSSGWHSTATAEVSTCGKTLSDPDSRWPVRTASFLQPMHAWTRQPCWSGMNPSISPQHFAMPGWKTLQSASSIRMDGRRRHFDAITSSSRRHAWNLRHTCRKMVFDDDKRTCPMLPRMHDRLLRDYFQENRQMAFLQGPQQVRKSRPLRALAPTPPPPFPPPPFPFSKADWRGAPLSIRALPAPRGRRLFRAPRAGDRPAPAAPFPISQLLLIADF